MVLNNDEIESKKEEVLGMGGEIFQLYSITVSYPALQLWW